MEDGLTPNTEYTYEVAAFDGQGNCSEPVTIRARTLTDGVAGYRATRIGPDGQAVNLEAQGTSLSDGAVEKGTRYTYAVAAVDKAGNASEPAEIAVQTLAHAPTQIEHRGSDIAAKHPKSRVKAYYMGDLNDETWVLYKG